MNKIRWGIAGPGNIAHKFAEAIRSLDEAELVAVASCSAERAQKFASEYDIPHIFSSYFEMANSNLIDAVYVSTAHPFHKECASIFLNAKKAVLCEKPLCANATQAKELRTIAKQNGAFLMEAMWTRFLPFMKGLENIIADDVIGEPMWLSADFCYSIENEEDPKLFDNSLAGGSLLDVGVYCLHFASEIFKLIPMDIKAVADVQNGIDHRTQIVLKYRGGKLASLSSAIKLEKPLDAYIYGTEGSIYIPSFYKADRFVVTKSDGEKEEYSFPYGENGFEFEILEVCRCIRQGMLESTILPLSKSIIIAEQTDTIRKQIGISYPFD